jgi:hypothetical protein
MKKLVSLIRMLIGFYVLPPAIAALAITWAADWDFEIGLYVLIAAIPAWIFYVVFWQYPRRPLLNILCPTIIGHLAQHFDWGRTEAQSRQRGCIIKPHEQMCIVQGCTAWQWRTHNLNFFIEPYGSCREWPRGAKGVHGSGD